jgi:hypothetical protein
MRSIDGRLKAKNIEIKALQEIGGSGSVWRAKERQKRRLIALKLTLGQLRSLWCFRGVK